jgi:hypothetical protein
MHCFIALKDENDKLVLGIITKIALRMTSDLGNDQG